MKKINFTFIILVALGLQTMSAQIPGYQGKRLSVGYNASSFFYFTDFQNGINGAVESTKISYKTEMILNYTLSRKVTAGFSYYFAKQVATFTMEQIPYVGNMIPKGETALCKLAIYELHFQFFRKNFIAPVGLYHQLSIGVVKYGLATSDNKLTVYPSNYGSGPSSLILDGPSSPFSCVKLGYAIGKTNPIGHNFYINTAFGINFFRGGDSAKVISGTNTTTSQNYIRDNFNKNLRTHNVLEIKIGLGWLAF